MDAASRKREPVSGGPPGSRRSLPALLGLLGTRAVLAAAYWGVVTPIGLVLRASGRVPLDVGFRDGRSSYWIAKTPSAQTLGRYEKPY